MGLVRREPRGAWINHRDHARWRAALVWASLAFVVGAVTLWTLWLAHRHFEETGASVPLYLGIPGVVLGFAAIMAVVLGGGGVPVYALFVKRVYVDASGGVSIKHLLWPWPRRITDVAHLEVEERIFDFPRERAAFDPDLSGDSHITWEGRSFRVEAGVNAVRGNGKRVELLEGIPVMQRQKIAQETADLLGPTTEVETIRAYPDDGGV